ncbi:hypothetical protein PAXRUDRAFT_11938 [Paxillus rubicundulus Ve08.2h10]|uniref:Uncharacterized protein n=1 Tax=Paxillus rubicundulus Ve08.2h10 TaxID=930991 RepID=A0A0D0E292_9AGAM|nr:hypothetical protein PAXRUDRAFT_11938 [Paxillus rubicundulus Ve08.2h10]
MTTGTQYTGLQKLSQLEERILLSSPPCPTPIPSATGLVLLIPVSVVALDIIRRLVPSSTAHAAWRAAYGEVLYARLLDQEVIVLNSQSDTVELLEKDTCLRRARQIIVNMIDDPDPYST